MLERTSQLQSIFSPGHAIIRARLRLTLREWPEWEAFGAL